MEEGGAHAEEFGVFQALRALLQRGHSACREQGLENYRPWAESHELRKVFTLWIVGVVEVRIKGRINSMKLEVQRPRVRLYWNTATPVDLRIIRDCLCSTTEKSSNSNSVSMVCKAENTYYLAGPCRRSFPSNSWSRGAEENNLHHVISNLFP